jgi:hypothetical protein
MSSTRRITIGAAPDLGRDSVAAEKEIRTMRRLLVLASLMGLLGTALLGTAGTATADPDLTLTAQPHRHYIQTANGLAQVGPRYCDDPSLRDAFTQFHANTHTHNGVIGEIGPVAPGLHNGKGAEIISGPC